MSVFHPQSGNVTLDVFENPRIYPSPLLMLTIKIEFMESMDPANPNEQQKASATFDVLPLLITNWRQLEKLTLDFPAVDELELCEGSIYFCGYHNPADLRKISFGTLEKDTILAQLSGEIDFTYEGLSHLGKPQFNWNLPLLYDQKALESVIDQFDKRMGE